jgi:hypothetical protein
MWHSIRRWRDWAIHELGAGIRPGSGLRALHYGYEKAGLRVFDQPIPWNAEAVLVEAEVGLPVDGPRRKSDFPLHLPGQEPLLAELLRREEGEDTHQLFFRFPPPGQSVIAELGYRNHLLGSFTLPALGKQEFINDLRLQMPTLFARLGEQSIACRTFVATQCRGLLLSAVLASPTSLAPLADLGLRVDLISESGGVQSIFATFCASQLGGNQALLTVVPRRFCRRIGTWSAVWQVGDRKLAIQQIRAISQRQFRQSLRVADARFVHQDRNQRVAMTRLLPPLGSVTRIGPCFIITSKEPGMAGICTLQLRTVVPGALGSRLAAEELFLVSDGPTMFAPGTMGVDELGEVSAFELRCKSDTLGSLPLCPAPAAAFNAEGGFKTGTDYTWSMAAEEELNNRLGSLYDGRNRK